MDSIFERFSLNADWFRRATCEMRLYRLWIQKPAKTFANSVFGITAGQAFNIHTRGWRANSKFTVCLLVQKPKVEWN